MSAGQGAEQLDSEFLHFWGFLIYDIWKKMWEHEKDLLVIFIKIQKRSSLYPLLQTYAMCVRPHGGSVAQCF